MRILLVEDDESIIEVVTAVLDQQNYVVDVATDGETGWELIEAFPYDLVLLDIVLPKLDGISLCRRLRSQKKQVLVMLLTAQDKMTDKLIGLDAGADDYVIKPFDVQELAARIRALLRRGSTLTSPVLTCGDLRLDPNACEVTYNGQLLRFSRKEYLLLELFLRHQQRVFSRSAIVDQIWSFNEDPPNEDTVKSHIKSIRRKLDAAGAGNLIETLYGQGYRINPAYLSEAQVPEEPTLQSQQALALSVTEIWQRTKGASLDRIRLLEEVVQALKTTSLDRELQQNAVQTAHKLVGSLGTFGFEAGSQLAQQLENLLQSELNDLAPQAQQQANAQIEPLVISLQQLLAGEPEPPSKQTTQQDVNLTTSPNAPPVLLIVDSDHELTAAIKAQSDEQSLRIAIEATVETAQAYCQQERPDIVLVDFSLLRASKQGRALITVLREPPGVPIVLLSTQVGSRDRVEAVHIGAHLFLQKPISPSAILETITNSLRPSNETALKVLAVDDDPLIAAVLTSCLAPQGIQLVNLQDPTQFWETLNRVRPDLLILDVNMPDINGLELCQTVRCDLQWSWLPILFLTAQTDQLTRQQIFSIGADDLVTKPIDSEELSNRILNRLRRIPRSGTLARDVQQPVQPVDSELRFNPVECQG